MKMPRPRISLSQRLKLSLDIPRNFIKHFETSKILVFVRTVLGAVIKRPKEHVNTESTDFIY